MRRGKDQAPAREMKLHQICEADLTFIVKSGSRLVEQPERPVHGDEPRERQPPPLTGREIRGSQVGDFTQANALKRMLRRVLRRTEIGAPKSQVFFDRQGRLQGILVAEVVRLFADARFGISAL
jgi:hypothetical protein